MLQKSLQVLIAAALAALALTLAYAALALQGPDEAIAEAQAKAAKGELPRAIAVLGFVEHDVRGDAERTATVLRLRSEWLTRLGRYEEALNDVRRLVSAGPHDLEARLTEIRLLALAGDGEAALRAAEAFLGENPGHGRGLELAGESGQTRYQPQLRALLLRLDRELPLRNREAARQAVNSYLYRPDLDPAIEAASRRLAAMHTDDPRLQTAWPALAAQLAALRAQVQATLDRFRASLEAPGEPVAAFRAVALALDQSQRRDDLLAQCEIQRRRFDHQYVDEAGAAAAWSLLRAGRNTAAIAAADRWLTPAVVDKRIADRTVGAGMLDLLTARSLAAFRSGDRDALERSGKQALPLWQTLKPTPAALPFCFAFLHETWDENRKAKDSFRYAFDLLRDKPTTVDRLDLLPVVAEGWLRAVERDGAAEADLQAALSAWARQRPQSTAPLLANIALQRRLGRPLAAAAVLQDVLAIDPDDDDTFAAYVEARRAEAAAAGRDGPALLRQMLERRADLPQVADPTGYLLCAEAALAVGERAHADRCARAATAAFPRARAPRLLLIRCLLAAGEAAEAATAAARLLDELPPEPATVALALTAFAAAGRSPRELLPRTMTTAGSPLLQTELLAQALADAPALAHRFVDAAAEAADAPADLRLLAATALAHADEPLRAFGLLAQGLAAAATPDAARPGLRSQAVAAWARAAAAAGAGDRDLAATAAPVLAAAANDPAARIRPLADAAEAIIASHPRTAALLLEDFLARAPGAIRAGVDYVHAGTAAARSGDWRLAEARWTAALAFADGRTAAESLARLALLSGRVERCQQVLAAGEGVTAIGLALRLGDDKRALALADAALQADGGDLLAHCSRALRGLPSLADWQIASGDLGALCSEVLAALHDDALAGLAAPKLTLMLQLAPRSTSNRLLHARALAATGRFADAAAAHAELVADGCVHLALLREVARAGADPAYVPAPAVQQALFDALLAGQLIASPPTLAYAIGRFQSAFRSGGFPGVADQVVATAWQAVAPTRPLADADIAAIVAHLPPTEALRVLLLALARPTPAKARARALDAIGALCERLVAADPGGKAVALATARSLVAAAAGDAPAGEAVPGRLLHLVLTHDAALDAPTRRAWLLRHLDAVARGGDDDARLPATVAALAAATDTASARAAIAEAIAMHPTSLALWQARTALAIAAGEAATAIPEFGAALAHCHAPALQLEHLVLAAEADLVVTDADRKFAALPASLREGRLGRYATGLMALRAGAADDAVRLLADAPPRTDGMHLFAQALAALQSRAADGGATARTLLLALQRDYPSSSAARNAGRFASQLAPR